MFPSADLSDNLHASLNTFSNGEPYVSLPLMQSQLRSIHTYRTVLRSCQLLAFNSVEKSFLTIGVIIIIIVTHNEFIAIRQ